LISGKKWKIIIVKKIKRNVLQLRATATIILKDADSAWFLSMLIMILSFWPEFAAGIARVI
jgi:hypothetical protein